MSRSVGDGLGYYLDLQKIIPIYPVFWDIGTYFWYFGGPGIRTTDPLLLNDIGPYVIAEMPSNLMVSRQLSPLSSCG